MPKCGNEGAITEVFWFYGQKLIDSRAQILSNFRFSTGDVAQLVRASDCRSEG